MDLNRLTNRLLLLLFLVGLWVMAPSDAYALQTHGEPEGLSVHQMAHIFYIFALGYLYWDTKRSGFSGKGWQYLRVFCVLTIMWNVLAIVGHGAAQQLEPSDFITVDDYLMKKMSMPLTAVKMVYYIAKYEHLVMVPAMFFLFLSLRAFYEQPLEEEK